MSVARDAERTAVVRNGWLLPAVAAMIVLAISLYLWNALAANEQRQIEQTTVAETSVVVNHLSAEVSARIQALDRMADRWAYHGRQSKRQWQQEAELNIVDFPGYQAILWVDPGNRVTWVAPVAGNEAVIGLDGAQTEEQREALSRSKNGGGPVSTGPLDLAQGTRGFIVYRPIFLNNDPKQFDGFIVGSFRITDLFDTILEDPVLKGYAISILNEGQEVYLRASEGRANEDTWGTDEVTALYGVDWQVRVWPESTALVQQESYLPELVLAAGLLSAVLLALSIRMTQVAHVRTLQAQVISAELNTSTLALEQSNKDLEEFAYIASHDLKAPLVSLRGMAEILTEDYGDHLPRDARIYLERITVNAGKMQNLLDDLLQISRVRQSDVEFMRVDLGDVVNTVVDQLGQMLDSRGAEVRMVSILPTVNANRLWMTQVFSNLIDNAVKYTPAGRRPLVEIGAVERDGSWELFVRDNGAGIPESYRNNVFRMFQRLPGGKSMNPNGTGMGLAIVARIIEHHNGTVWVESTEGEETTFFFTLAKSNVASVDDAEQLMIQGVVF
ncbi:hypothetical protein BH23CHL1_BH23CHL1_16370 [soil metagenome]